MSMVTQYGKMDLGGTVVDRPQRRAAVAPAKHTSPRGDQKSPQSRRNAKPSDERKSRRFINWPNVLWLALLHVGCLAAPFFFSWQAVILTLALHWLTGGIGICLGFHRHLTHTSFTTYKPVRWLLAFIGGLAGEGPAVDWVANHRKHHAHSDQEGDPHSPHDGPWWSHAFWLAFWKGSKAHAEHLSRWAPDVVKDPVLRWIGYMFLPSHFALAGLLMAAGYW